MFDDAPPSRARRLTVVELLFWSTVLVGAVSWRVQPTLRPLMANDSFQYISTADNFHKGLPGYTSFVYFDEERAHGVVPAPLTTFPLGYPALIAGVMYAGLSAEHAALLVSVTAAIGAAWLMAFIARQLELGTWGARAAVVMFGSSYWVLTQSSTALTESTFTVLVMAGVAGAIEAVQAAHSARPWSRAAVVAGLCFGATYWVRHAGLFVCLALPVYGALMWRRPAFRPVLLATGLAGVAVVSAIVRNVALTGGWRGGNNKFVHHEWREIVRQLVDSVSGLILGPPIVSSWASGRSLLAAVLILVVVTAVGLVALRPALRQALRQRLGVDAGLLVLLVGVYTAGVTYAASRTMITFGTRFFVPMLPPVVLIVTAAGVAIGAALPPGPARRGWRGLCAVAVVLGALVHVDLFRSNAVSPTRERMERRLAAPLDAQGRNAYDYVASATRDGDVIVANMGQATGYLLRRPAVALSDPAYSDVVWTEDEVQGLCARYSARLLIVHKVAADATVDGYVSPFVKRLASASAPPWLSVVVDAPTMTIYRPRLPGAR